MDSMGERLAFARKKAGYEKAKDATTAFGWNYSNYIGHENGSRNFKLGMARVYGSAYKVSWQWLMTGEGDAGPAKGEKKIVSAYRKLAPEDQALLETMAEQLAQRKRTQQK